MVDSLESHTADGASHIRIHAEDPFVQIFHAQSVAAPPISIYLWRFTVDQGNLGGDQLPGKSSLSK